MNRSAGVRARNDARGEAREATCAGRWITIDGSAEPFSSLQVGSPEPTKKKKKEKDAGDFVRDG